MVLLFFLTLFGHILSFDANQYDHTQVVWQRSGEDIYTIYWSIETEIIKMALEVKTLGWIGFGIAEQSSGTMAGSDILQGFVKSDNTVEFKDRYVLRQLPGTNWFQAPLTDKCQDWTLINGEETNGTTILEVTRLIDTQDSQDRAILLNGITKIILAYGADDEDVWDTYHTGKRRLATFLDFSGVLYNNPIDVLKKRQGIEVLDFFGRFNVTTDEASIEQQGSFYDGMFAYADVVDDVTVYFKYFIDLSPILEDGDIHIIGIEDVIKDETKRFVHHFVLHGYFFNGTANPIEQLQLYAWAPGVHPSVMDQCGFRASKTTGFDSLRLETHYDNPGKEEGFLDTSGVRIYYTREAPPYDCSMFNEGQGINLFWLGEDPWLIPGKTKYVYECLDIGVDVNGEDLDDWNGIPEITIFSENLHMHAIGREMWTEIKRAGAEWIKTQSIEFWDFNFQSFQKPRVGEYTIKKGDSLRVTCIFETELGEPTHKFGLASNDEMCLGQILYYPRVAAFDQLCNYASGSGKVTRTVEANTSYVTDFGKLKENADCPAIMDYSEATMSKITSTILYIVAFSISLH